MWGERHGPTEHRFASQQVLLYIKGCAEREMRRRIVRIQRDRLFEAGHRLLVAADFGEHPTEITMRLRSVGSEVEGPAKRRLGFGEPLETHQSVGVIDMCPEKLRDQRDSAFGTRQTCCEFLLLIERSRKVVVRHAVIGVKR